MPAPVNRKRAPSSLVYRKENYYLAQGILRGFIT